MYIIISIIVCYDNIYNLFKHYTIIINIHIIIVIILEYILYNKIIYSMRIT